LVEVAAVAWVRPADWAGLEVKVVREALVHLEGWDFAAARVAAVAVDWAEHREAFPDFPG
jgi:hypothetical protein